MSIGATTHRRRLLAGLVGLTLLVAACGDASSEDADSSASQAATETADATTSDEQTESPSDDEADASLTISHKYGDAVVSGAPERVVTLGYSEQDPVLALGVTPVAVREWFGGFDYAVWPWAQDELGSGEPEVLDMPFGELNFETIAALEPDLIVATHAGITEEEYNTLAEIAPTLVEDADVPPFGMAWQDQTAMIGTALGLSDEADQAIAVVEASTADAARDNESIDGTTFAWVNPTGEGTYWVVGQSTPPMKFLQELGLVYEPAIADVVGDADSLEFSAEQIALLDVDLLLVQADEQIRDDMEADPLWSGLEVMANDQILWLTADDPVYGALSFSTILSVDFLVDELPPLLAEKLGEGGAAVDDPEAQAAIDAFAVVFDSDAEWSAKTAYLEGADELEASNEAYRQAGTSLGGIKLEPTDAVIEADTATITYDVLFGSSAAYNDLTRTVTLVEGTWTVSRSDYCDFLASARTPCSE